MVSLLLSAVLAQSAGEVDRASDRIEGDAGLLKLLENATKDNLGKFPRGRAVYRYTDLLDNDDHRRESVLRIEGWWSGERARVRVRGEEDWIGKVPAAVAPDQPPPKVLDKPTELEMLFADGKIHVYDRLGARGRGEMDIGSNLATCRIRHAMESDIRPAELWNCTGHPYGGDWTDVLGPIPGVQWHQDVRRWKVSRDGQFIDLTLFVAAPQGIIENHYRADLTQGGLPVRCRAAAYRSETVFHTDMAWIRKGDGLVLQSLENTFSRPNPKRNVKSLERYELVEFDFDLSVPDDFFEIEPFKEQMRRMTEVDDRVRRKRYRYREDEKVTEDDLKRLGRTLGGKDDGR